MINEVRKSYLLLLLLMLMLLLESDVMAESEQIDRVLNGLRDGLPGVGQRELRQHLLS